MELWNGAAWFSAWFYQRLHWPAKPEIKRLDALQPHLPDGAWEALLLAIRDHLEQQMPFDLKICARLLDGSSEWWHIQGSTEHNAGGQPVSLACTSRDVSTTPNVGSEDSEGEP